MKYILPFSLFLLALIFDSCRQGTGTLFRLVEGSDSGLDFKNTLYQSERLNIINLEYFYNGGGVGIGDFNKDGLQDVFFTGNMVPNKIYLNKGGLTFEDFSKIAGIGGDKKWKSGLAVVDINSDGWLDIYVCSTISEDSLLRTNMLFVNQGLNKDGYPTFIDKAHEYGIDFNGYSSNAGFFDYDADGDLDLYILTNSRQRGPVNYRPKINDGSSINNDRLYRNNGNNTFTDVSKESGIVCEGYGLGLAFLDANKDGRADVYIGNDYITNDLLYINEGNGKFANEIDQSIKHQSKFSMGNDAADINNDGFLDIITVDMLPETNLRKKTVIGGSGYITYINDKRFGYAHQYIRNMLQLNNGNNTFSEIGQLAGVYQTEWSWSPLFADFDNDGFKDLLITNGFPKDITDRDFISFREKSGSIASIDYLLKEVPSVKVPNYAFKNNADLTFTDVTKLWGMDQPSFSCGAAYADFDNDGDLDYVVNNIDAEVSLYENTLNSNGVEVRGHYLRLKLQGPKGNTSGLGAKITVYQDTEIQYFEHTIYRGYISTVEDAIHIGLGNKKNIDSLRIVWVGGNVQVLRNVKADQVLTVRYDNAQKEQRVTLLPNDTPLKNVTSELNLKYKHNEEEKIDFNIQRTLPHKFTQSGPGVAVGDVNSDGLDDFCLGGAANNTATIFLQGINKTFKAKQLPKTINASEDEGLLLFDADNDSDLDLYCVSGSYEYNPGGDEYLDRLYLNDGKGNFKEANNALPPLKSSGSCVRACDFDGDGDLDLFIGGRVALGKYPFADDSYVLVNKNGKFTDETKKLCPGLVNPGIVSDALWTDFDNDQKTDLIVVGEFMQVKFFKNLGNKFNEVKNTGIENFKGWFNSISGGDFDSDGDTDYIVGNLGINNYYNVSSKQPLTICAKDFDNNSSIDAVVSCYIKSEDGTLKQYPVHFWDELNSQSPKFRRQFSKYSEFATTTMAQFFKPEDLKGALILDANYLHTSYIENLGNGHFSMKPLGNLAQVAPVNGMLVDDFTNDGNLDALLIGNDYGNDPTNGQYDAFTGLLLQGNGKGDFQIVPSSQSGFFVNGDAKGLAKISGGDVDYYLATQNQDSVKIFSTTSGKVLQEFKPAVLDSYAYFVFADNGKQKMEFYYGSGYLSQSSRSVRIPLGVKAIIVYDSKGKSREVAYTK